MAKEKQSYEGVAIIGMAGRFPGADNIDQFWKNLSNGIESITFFSNDELLENGVEPERFNNEHYVKAAPILEGIELFDAHFFGLSPREAEMLDPQHRLFVETAWKALEQAGYDGDRFNGSVGVYGGCGINNYSINNLMRNPEFLQSVNGNQLLFSNDKDFLCSRTSYHLNLTGPSVTVQSACSSSMLALHLACESILNQESDMAIAGGVALAIPQVEGYLYEPDSILSPDGHCRAFDKDAAGTVFGSAVAMVVLKDVNKAIDDGDTIWALIRGTATNNDGSDKMGFTAPSVQGQSDVITSALEYAEIDPATISYVEAHGTGTAIGDPIEIEALTAAYQHYTDKTGYCLIGSLKPNIGHLDTVAGIAGIIKTVLALKHEAIPPSLNFETPNPKIDFEQTPFVVNTKLTPWKQSDTPRRAAVSSFGIGGTNVHTILEEAPILPKEAKTEDHLSLLPLSAKTETALQTSCENLADYLESNKDSNLDDVAHTLQVGRKELFCRKSIVCQNHEEAIQQLRSYQPSQATYVNQDQRSPEVTLLFTGQGAQYANMGLGLYQEEPEFQATVDECLDLLQPLLSKDLRSMLFPTEERVKEAQQELSQTEFTQPALFVIEYALAKFLIAKGVRVHSMIGHSLGEYVAACLSGVFSLADALKLVAKRGQLIQSLPKGSMMVVPLPADQLRPRLGESISIAAENQQDQTVLAGTDDAIETLKQALKAEGIASIPLHTSHAFHSAMMEPILDTFKECVAEVTRNAPQIPFISNRTGEWITTEEATDPDYWSQHIRSTVLFAKGVRTLLQPNESDQSIHSILVEVGPGKTLTTFVNKQLNESISGNAIQTIRHPKTACSDRQFLYGALAAIHDNGVSIDWDALRSDRKAKRIPLPTYPFERNRYWIEGTNDAPTAFSAQSLRKDFNGWFYKNCWKVAPPRSNKKLSEESTGWLLLMDNQGIGDRLKQRLEALKHDVITIDYEETAKTQEQYELLLKTLKEENRTPSIVVNLQNITEENDVTLDSLPQFRKTAFESPILLMKAWGNVNLSAPLRFAMISNHVQKVLGTERINPAKSMLLGPMQVIPVEFPEVKTLSIDLDWQSDSITTEETDLLITELQYSNENRSIAWRNGMRFIQDIEKVHTTNEQSETRSFREGGVYLITGGLGGVGLTMAETIAQTVSAKFVLTGRSEFPEQETWQQWLQEHGPEDSVSQTIQRLRHLQSIGAELMIVTNDCRNPEETRQLAMSIKEQFGPVNGILHAAGVPGKHMIQFGTIEQYLDELSPKTVGTCVLMEAFADHSPEIVILFSSINSWLAGPGQTGYSAANIFMDSFAKNHDSIISINWPTFSDVGMAVNAQPDKSLTQEQKLMAISPQEGGEAMKWIVNQSELNNVAVFPLSPEDFLKEAAKLISEAKEQQWNNRKRSKESLFPRPNLTTPYEAPTTDQEQQIVGFYQELLGFEKVGVHDNFFELGGHSLLATSLLARIRESLQIEMPIADFFENSTPSKVAKNIEVTLRTLESAKQEKVEVMENEMELEL